MKRLKDKFCSIANAIRIRTGKTGNINCCDIEKEILNIGEVQPSYITVDDNGVLSFSNGSTVTSSGVLEVL